MFTRARVKEAAGDAAVTADDMTNCRAGTGGVTFARSDLPRRNDRWIEWVKQFTWSKTVQTILEVGG